MLVENPRIEDDGETHATEQDWQKQTPDYTIVNDGNFEVLYAKIDQMLATR